MSSIHVTVPIVFWGKNSPSHEITCICVADEDRGIATGSKSGQICIWDLYRKGHSKDVVLRPRLLLFGSHGSILSLSFCKNWSGDRDRVVSLCDKRFICLWDGKDGTCIKTTSSLRGRHSGIKSFSLSNTKETLIAVWGHYSSIHIMESNTLENICTLKSSHNPNWVSQICFIPNVDKKDALAAITVDGTFKLWLLQSTSEMKEMGELFEEKSKALGVKNPLTLSSVSTGIHTSCVALVTCRLSWQLYDATEGKMKLLLIRHCEEGVRSWMGGELLSYNMLIAWSTCGAGYLYQIDAHILPGLQDSTNKDGATTAGCSLLCIFSPNTTVNLSQHSVTFVPFINQKWHILGDNEGRLQVWHIDSVLKNAIAVLQDHTQPVVNSHHSAAISDSWKAPALPCSLTDSLYPEDAHCPDITCSLYLTKFGRLICGQSNGEIVVLFATQAATKLLLQKRNFSRTWPQHYFLKGHTGRVTTLLYPCDFSSAYDSNHLLSGGSDFSVRLWDLYRGTLIHMFAVHGGDVKLMVTCPPDSSVPRMQNCVCSIAEDNSVAILSTSQNKCLMLASCHTAPVKSVHWRLDEDFLLVYCTDGRLYVWQIETGTLDRCVEGEVAQMILKNNKTATNPLSSIQPTSPIQVRSLSFGKNHSLVQVILFDPQFLINKLHKMERTELKPRQVQQPSQVRAFRTYISARRSYSLVPTDTTPGKNPSPTLGIDQSPGIPREQARAMEAIGDAMVGGQKEEVIKPESPAMTINIARLLVSCLHAWNLDDMLDRECENMLGLVRPCKPVSFGLLSRGGSLSLVLPGWGLVPSTPTITTDESTDAHLSVLNALSNPHRPLPTRPHSLAVVENVSSVSSLGSIQGIGGDDLAELAYHVRWQLSRSLTTQHLLTVVSITNTLMNQTIGAHSLAASSGVRTHSETSDSDGSSSDDDITTKDNRIRATWSRVAALHCVMLPERMAGYFRPPHLPVLASRFMDPTQAIREAAQALLQAELRRVGIQGRRELVSDWSNKLLGPIHNNYEEPKNKTMEIGIEMIDIHATPTQQQQITSLVILGMIGAEFNSCVKVTPSRKSTRGSSRRDTYTTDYSSEESTEILDPSIARQTAKTLQAFLLEKPASKSSLYSSLRCSAAELMGRGFHLWENYVDVPAVVMGLLDLSITPGLPSSDSDDDKTAKKLRSIKFVADIARRALNLMVLLRPITIVTAIAKEVSMFLVSPHGTSSPHSSLPQIQVGVTLPPNTAGIVTRSNVLLPSAKNEILELMRTVLEKCSSQVTLQLLDVVDIVLFCLDQDELKKRNYMINELFPSLTKLPNISYCLKNRRLAVGSRSGQVGVYDLKQRKTQMISAHTHAVNVLCFSEDGKYLATYSYGDSTLTCWLVGSSFFGGVISQTPRCINSWPAISSSAASNYSNFVRLEWFNNKTLILYMPEGVEYRYSL